MQIKRRLPQELEGRGAEMYSTFKQLLRPANKGFSLTSMERIPPLSLRKDGFCVHIVFCTLRLCTDHLRFRQTCKLHQNNRLQQRLEDCHTKGSGNPQHTTEGHRNMICYSCYS